MIDLNNNVNGQLILGLKKLIEETLSVFILIIEQKTLCYNKETLCYNKDDNLDVFLSKNHIDHDNWDNNNWYEM